MIRFFKFPTYLVTRNYVLKYYHRNSKKHLTKIILSDQCGFMASKNMSTVSMSIIATLNHILSQNGNAQFIYFDFSRVFDKILPDVHDRILRQVLPNGTISEAIISLTSGGKFRANVGNCFSEYKK